MARLKEEYIKKAQAKAAADAVGRNVSAPLPTPPTVAQPM
jgi:hypothetical protein